MEEGTTDKQWLARNWGWLVLAGAIVFLLLLSAPATLYYWNYSSFVEILHNKIGLDKSWSKVGAIALSIAYALAIPYAIRWFILGRRSQRVTAVAATFFILAVAPAMDGMFGTIFDPVEGTPNKWYVVDSDGQIKLFDTDGYDPDLAIQRRPLTPEVAKLLERQRKGTITSRIDANPRQITFFDPATGRPRVWYHRDSSGHIVLYDTSGYSPVDGQELLPVTKSIVDELLRNSAAKQPTTVPHASVKQRVETKQNERAAANNEIRERALTTTGVAVTPSKNQSGVQFLNHIDQQYLSISTQRALEGSRSGTSVDWRNPETGNYGSITPQPPYALNNTYCRSFIQITVANEIRTRVEGSGCRMPDGSWRING